MQTKKNICLLDVVPLDLLHHRLSISEIWAPKVNQLVMSSLLESYSIIFFSVLLSLREKNTIKSLLKIELVTLLLTKNVILKFHPIPLIFWSKCLKENLRIVSMLKLLSNILSSTTRWTFRCQWNSSRHLWMRLKILQSIRTKQKHPWLNQQEWARGTLTLILVRERCDLISIRDTSYLLLFFKLSTIIQKKINCFRDGNKFFKIFVILKDQLKLSTSQLDVFSSIVSSLQMECCCFITKLQLNWAGCMCLLVLLLDLMFLDILQEQNPAFEHRLDSIYFESNHSLSNLLLRISFWYCRGLVFRLMYFLLFVQRVDL